MPSLKNIACCYYAVFLLVFTSPLLHAQTPAFSLPKQYTLVYNLCDEWQVYDVRRNAYVPYIEVIYRNPKSMSLWLDAAQYNPYKLVFYVPADSYLFINHTLAQHFKREGWQVLRIDSLRNFFQRDTLFLTFYDTAYRLPLKNIYVANYQPNYAVIDATNKKNTELVMLKRKGEVLQDFTNLFFLIIILFFTFVWASYRSIFVRYYSLRSSLSVFLRDDALIVNKPLSLGNLAYILLLAMVLAYAHLLIAKRTSTGENNLLAYLWLDSQQLWHWALAYSLLVICLFAVLLFKYFFNTLFANLLGLDKIIAVHYFEYIRLSYLFYPNFVLLHTFLYLSFPAVLASLLSYSLYIIFIFHIIQILFILFYTYSHIKTKHLYIFYYLSITEITPLLIAIKLLM